MPSILIIDDLEDNTTLIRETLLTFFPDAELYVALGGREGLSRAEELNSRLDLIILDANMPDLSGFEVCERHKGNPRLSSCPILMLSAVFVNSKDRIRGLESGADGYLCKPYHIEELIAQVKVLLRIKQKEDELLAHKSNLTTELAVTTDHLSQAEQHFRTIFEVTPDAIYLLNAQFEFVDINPAGCAMHGRTYDEIIGEHLTRFVSYDQLDPVFKRLDACRESGSLPEFETEVTGLGRPRIPVSVTGKTILYKDQACFLLNLRDISERKEAEEQLRTAQKMDAVGRLAGGIAHDFNNMLTTILGYSFLIKEHSKVDAACNDADQIIAAAERATRLTRQLLVFGRKQMLPLHPVELNIVLQEIDHLLRRTIGEHIELVTLFDDDLPYVNSDEGHLEQVILNLSVNARDAMPDGGKMVIQTKREELKKTVTWQGRTIAPGIFSVLSVTDDGTGMDPQVLKQVFEPFFTTKKRSSGIGMGLSTVYGIVKNSGGFVEIDTQLEKGTTVRVFFPQVEIAPEIASQIRSKAELPRGDETILLVEDEDLLRRLTNRVLSSLGYTIIEARHGEEALRIAQTHQGKIDLLISDVIMPRLGGPELVSQLKLQGLNGMKVLFISGFTDEAFCAENLGSEHYALLLKPYTKATIAQKIRDVIDQKPALASAK